METIRRIVAGCVVCLAAAAAVGQSESESERSSLVDVRVVTDEADAVLALLDKRARQEPLTEADWEALYATEGYRRLRERDESFGIETFVERFRDWVLSVDLETVDTLRGGIDRWRVRDVTHAGNVAAAYLPDGAEFTAKIYPVLKHTSNSFVYQADTDPAIFMNVTGTAPDDELLNTLAHELHHIGGAAACPEPGEPPSEAAAQVLRWMDAFGEGLAMLAAAGGPDTHPHAGRADEEWNVWERDVLRFPEDVRRIERFFLDILSGELDEAAQWPRFIELINTPDVPQGAFYTVGWKMGAMVERRFGRDAVVRAICDMPDLLVAYNQIAHELQREDGGSLPGWSPELLRAIGAPDVVGTWRAHPERNGQAGDFVVRFEAGEDGTLQAVLSIPPLDAWNAMRAPAEVFADRVEIGGWVLRRTEDGGLTTTLPASMVPIHEVEMTLYPSDPVERSAPEPIEAPVAKPLWSRDLGSPVWAGVLADDGSLYVGADDGHVYALDATSGDERWRYRTGGKVRSRPVVADRVLYAHSDDGHLHAIDATSGEPIWQAKVAAEPVERIPLGAEGARYNHYASSALVGGDTLFIGGFDGNLYALDKATGTERWRFAAGDTIAGTPALAGDRVIFGSFDGHVYAVDAAAGTEIWRYDTGAAVVSTPLVHDGRAIVGSRSYDIYAFDVATGEPDWGYYYWFSWVESSAVERDGLAYVGSSDGQLVVGIDAVDGSERWRFDTGGSPWSQPAVTETTVFIGTVGVADYMVAHAAALFALDRLTGEPLWQVPVERPGDAGHWGFGASTAVDDARIFAARLDGRVLAFPQDGGVGEP